MLTWILLGVMPPTVEEVLPGPQHVNVATNPSRQVRLSPLARGFRETWGPAVFRWHEETATPQFVRLSGVPVDQATALVGDLARLARVDLAELTLAHVGEQANQRVLRFDRVISGAPVFENHIALVVKSGRIAGAWVRLHPGTPVEPALPGEEYLVVDQQIVPATRIQRDHVVRYISRDGTVVGEWSRRRYAQLDIESNARSVGGGLVSMPAQGVTVSDGITEVITDGAGQHDLSGAVDVALNGPWIDLEDLVQPAEATVDADGTLVGGHDISMAAATVHNHFNVIGDWLVEHRPDHPVLDTTILAQVNDPDSCNAHYLDGEIVFKSEDDECNNFGEIADLAYHEMGHAIHDFGLQSGIFAVDVGEGSADFFSSTITGDPIMGLDAGKNGDYLREMDTNKVYPDDVIGQSHHDGLVWASFLWDLRTDWMKEYGADQGRAMVEDRFLGALEQGPSLLDTYDAMIVADDDDGDLTNGTPHGCELAERMNAHGIGPGSFGVLSFDHTPLGPQSSFAADYPVVFELFDINAGCSTFDDQTIRLWVTTEDLAPPEGVPPVSGGAWGAYQEVPLTRDGVTYEGIIPRQFPGTGVRYVMTGNASDGSEYFSTHEYGGVYTFWVGDRETLFCEDFEGEVTGWGSYSTWNDDWELGPVDPDAGGPTAAASGDNIYATNLSGAYEPYTQRRLGSPGFDVSGHGDMLLLSYQRMLSVYDGAWDQASIEVNDEPVWQNAAGDSPWDLSHYHVDPGWVTHDLPIADLVDGEGMVQFQWKLSSSTWVNTFFGWAIDDVCVTQLIPMEEHYRVRDLAVQPGSDAITVSWTQPYVDPFNAAVLVRSAKAYPETPDQGEVVDLDLSPVLGGYKEVVDPDVAAGDGWYYTLFAAGTDQDWIITGAVEGENAGFGQVPGNRNPEDGLVEADPETEKKKGCSHVPVYSIWLLGLVGVGVRRKGLR